MKTNPTPVALRGFRAALKFALLAGTLGALSACALLPASSPKPSTAPDEALLAAVDASPEPAPQPVACPAEVPATTRCLQGQDRQGAHYVIALPPQWQVLVLHAHGGPVLGAPRAQRVIEDLKRWSIMVRAGYAWAGSSFAQGGVAVRSAAQDTERLRRIFLKHVGQPQRTVLHGQSWGAGVAAKAAEMYAPPGVSKAPYDAVFLSSGVLGGGPRSYEFRLDLRVLYQYLCNNHPSPEEAAYPLWMGLPEGSKLNQADLAARSKVCLGLGLPAAQRSPEQATRLKTLLTTLKIEERSLQGHLNWATFHFADIARRYQAPVLGNLAARYSGSPDDAALNAAVLRYRPDAKALAAFEHDTSPSGAIGVPVLSVHATRDPVAFVELESRFRQTMAQAGQADRLVQVFTQDSEHSYLSDPLYPTLIEGLLAWAQGGAKPTPAALAQRCAALQASWGPGCRIDVDYRSAPLETRVTPR